MADRALALALCGLGLLTGCAGLPHAYRPAQARDETSAGVSAPNPETCAVLLVPEMRACIGVTCSRAGRRAWWMRSCSPATRAWRAMPARSGCSSRQACIQRSDASAYGRCAVTTKALMRFSKGPVPKRD